MKTKSKSRTGGLWAVICMAAALLAGCQAVEGQVTPLAQQEALTNNVFVVGGTVYTNPATAKPFMLYGGQGLSVSAQYRGASLNTTGQVGLCFGISVDGVNYTGTNNGFWAVLTPGGANWVQGWTLVPNTTVRHAAYGKLLLITNNNAATNMSAVLSNVLINIGP